MRRAPRARSASTRALPMPRLAPVTNAVVLVIWTAMMMTLPEVPNVRRRQTGRSGSEVETRPTSLYSQGVNRTPSPAADPVPAPSPGSGVVDRLLATAGELFYREGIHSVGIQRVIEEAGVAKAS